MNDYVLIMLLKVGDGDVKNREKRDVERGDYQIHYPDMDSPNWGKYHDRDMELALIKMRPLVPMFEDLCSIPNWLEGVEGDDNFEMHYWGLKK